MVILSKRTSESTRRLLRFFYISLVLVLILGVSKILPQSTTDPAPGYVSWFKADAIVGLTDGSAVSTWEDSGPANKDATQGNASYRPFYKTNVVNGKPVVRFDGANDRLVSPSSSDVWGLTNHFTVIAVVRIDPAASSNKNDVVSSSAWYNWLSLTARHSNANGNWVAYGSYSDGTRYSDLVLPTDSWHVITWRLHANPPKHLQIRVDKVYRLNDTSYTGIGVAPWPAAIGGRDDGYNFFKGDIAEIVFYTGSISEADMNATEDYLLAKYGLGEPPPTAPAAPSQLTATAIDHMSIDVDWVDNATNEDGYRVERREGQSGSFSEIAGLGSNAVSHVDQPLPGESEFCYRVVAFNAGGDSNPSSVACATTPIPPADPDGEPPAAGYVAWFRSNAIFGLNDDDPVGVWQDTGPNNHHAVQATASYQPIFKSNVVAGRPAVRFDGTNDRLISPGGSDIWGLTNHFTAFAVVRLDQSPDAGNHDVVGSSALSNNLDLIARRSNVHGNWVAYHSSPDGTHHSDFLLPTDSWHVVTWRLHANSPKHLQIRVDKTYHLNDTNYTGIGTAPGPVAIGARDDGGNALEGDIAELLFYTTSLSDAEMNAVEDYLLEKYGLEADPPAGTVACTQDPGSTQDRLIEILTGQGAYYSWWRQETGLPPIDIEELILVTDDEVCNQLWGAVAVEPPRDYYYHAFFQQGDVYFVTEYPDTDPESGVWGPHFTAAVDDQFNLMGPILRQ